MERRSSWVSVIRVLGVAASLNLLAHIVTCRRRGVQRYRCSTLLHGVVRLLPLWYKLRCERDGPLWRSVVFPPAGVAHQFHDPHISCRRRSHHHQSLCRPCLTCHVSEIWGAQLSLKTKHKWTRDAPQVIREGWGALMTLKRSPQYAQAPSCDRRCHGREIGTQQRLIIVTNGSAMSRSVGLRSSFIVSSRMSLAQYE